MNGDHHTGGFDRDRWALSVADRTLHVTAPDANDRTDSDVDARDRAGPVECRLCEATVLPVSATPDRGPHCPVCGFVTGELPRRDGEFVGR